jgi:hypothetical protein
MRAVPHIRRIDRHAFVPYLDPQLMNGPQEFAKHCFGRIPALFFNGLTSSAHYP